MSTYDVIIIGGSFAGLSAAMALGRSRRKVLIIDSNQPCNKNTPHSHNFITHDGDKPAEVKQQALKQVLAYDTVSLQEDSVVSATASGTGFSVSTGEGQTFSAGKLLFATGLKDNLPEIPGFRECWGISLIHCPYCHGYEVRDTPLGIVANGDIALHYIELLVNWSKDLRLFTNGPSELSEEQLASLEKHQVKMIETPIKELHHGNGYMKTVELLNGDTVAINTLFTRSDAVQHSSLPADLGCELKNGLIVVDQLQHTSIPGIYAAGDNSNMFRALSVAVAAGTTAGASINRDLSLERF